MIQLNLDPGPLGALRVLCLGCHSDDIEIGCGGAILRMAAQYTNCAFHWVVFSAGGVRGAEARRGAELFAGAALAQEPVLKTFPDAFMPAVGAEVKVASFDGVQYVDVIGVSLLSGAHMTLFPLIIDALQAHDVRERFLLVGGGVMPDEDVEALKEMGVAEILGQDTPPDEVAQTIRALVADRGTRV